MDYLEVIRSQYQASLEMLKHAILKCPQAIWNDPADKNKSWYIAYQALFYTHYYLQDTAQDFQPWQGHWDDRLPELPQIAEGYSRAEVLDYLSFCQQQVDQQVPRLNLEAESGFRGRPPSKFELQLYTIRHIQGHAGELMERLGTRAQIDVDWVGTKHN
jgi:hypothetical protein